MLKLVAFLGVILAVSAFPTDQKYLDDHAEELENQFQGDMIISQAELDAFNGRIDETLRWKDNLVPYMINMTYFTTQQAAYIHHSVGLVNALHCITLVNRTNEADYIQFTGDSTGCSSQVGRRGGMQTIKLKPADPEVGCFRAMTIVHELHHAFGFHHMQASYDRDDFVRIVWEYIQAGTENNFVMYGTDRVSHFGVEYDYGSMMHYSATAFSINGQDTIVATRNLNGLKMGQREHMTEKDILRMKRMYGCAPVPH